MKFITVHKFYGLLYLGLLLIVSVNMGDGGNRYSTSNEPIFAALEEKEGSFFGTINDDGIITEIRDLSFFGQTKVSGIRTEIDDSFNSLDLAKIKIITIINSAFQSKRYSDKEFVLINVLSADGTLTKNLLVPKNVVICGIDKTTGAEKTWWLRKVDKIFVGKKSTLDAVLARKKKELAQKRQKQKIKREVVEKKKKEQSLKSV